MNKKRNSYIRASEIIYNTCACCGGSNFGKMSICGKCFKEMFGVEDVSL